MNLACKYRPQIGTAQNISLQMKFVDLESPMSSFLLFSSFLRWRFNFCHFYSVFILAMSISLASQHTLHIVLIPFWLTSLETFTKHFRKYGEITDSVIMKDKHTKRPRGFGFITFTDPAVVEKVLEDEHVIDGRAVEVKRTVPREDMQFNGGAKTKKIFVGGIPPSFTEDELKEYFSSYGDIVEHQIMLDHDTGRSRGFGFVTFESEVTVEEIIAEGKTHELGGKQVEVKKAEPKRGGSDHGYGARAHFGGGYSNSYGGFGSGAAGYGGSYRSRGRYGGGMARGYGGYGEGYSAGPASFYGGYGYGVGYGYGFGGAGGYGGAGYGVDGYGGSGGYGGAYSGGGSSSYGGGRGNGANGRFHPYGR